MNVFSTIHLYCTVSVYVSILQWTNQALSQQQTTSLKHYTHKLTMNTHLLVRTHSLYVELVQPTKQCSGYKPEDTVPDAIVGSV